MAEQITQVISQFPPAPNSATDTPQLFNTKANAFVEHQADTYQPEVNIWATQANAVSTEINNIVATLPGGVIDDNTPSTINTYSSQKIEDDIVISDPTSSKWDGVVLDETTTPKLSEVGIVGASQSAKLFPDGSISGASSNGFFIKNPNGSWEGFIQPSVSNSPNLNNGNIFSNNFQQLMPPLLSTSGTLSVTSGLRGAATSFWTSDNIIDDNNYEIRVYSTTAGSAAGVLLAIVMHGRWK